MKPLPNLRFLVLNTNAPKSTAEAVELVRQLKENEPDRFEETIGMLGDTTELVEESLALTKLSETSAAQEPVDYFGLVDAISMNQQYLQELGVSGPKIDAVVAICMERELHAKLTGGGGKGGCLIGFYVPQDSSDYCHLDDLRAALTKEGFGLLEGTKLETQGLLYE